MTIGCGFMATAERDSTAEVYLYLIVAGLGVGGIVVPASVMAQVICPDDLIATVTALTLTVRIIGGAVGYAIYYNVFKAKLTEKLAERLVPVAVVSGLREEDVAKVVNATVASLLPQMRGIQGVTPEIYDWLVRAGQLAYAEAYPYVYYCSIGFGVVSAIASLFVDDVSQYMDNRVAVVIR